MENDKIAMNILNSKLGSKSSRELIELLDRDKFNEFVEKNVGILPFYYSLNSLYYMFCRHYDIQDNPRREQAKL